MDVVLLSEKTLRIKGKTSSIIVNPTAAIGKTEAEATVWLGEASELSDAKVEGSRITIKGPGEYEISGTKISLTKVDSASFVEADVDGVKVLVGSGPAIEKSQDKVEGCDIAVVDADSEFNYSALTSIEPKVLLIYGQKSEDVIKAVGKTAEKVSKFSTTVEKLPAEMQVFLLG